MQANSSSPREEEDQNDQFEYRAQVFCENASGVVVSSRCFSKDSSRVLIATTESEITIWDCNTDEVVEVMESANAKDCKQVFYCNNNDNDSVLVLDTLLACSLLEEEEEAGKWSSGRSLLETPNKDFTPVQLCLGSGGAGTRLCTVCTSTGRILVVDLQDAGEKANVVASSPPELDFFPPDLLPFDSPQSALVSSHEASPMLAFGLKYSNTVCLVNVATTTLLLQQTICLDEYLRGEGDDDVFVKCAQSATHLALVTDFGRVLVFRTTSAAGQGPIISITGSYSCAHFSPNGRYLFLASRQGNAIWSVAARAESHQLERPCAIQDRECTTCAFSPNGRIVAASCDAGIYLWDVEFGRYLGALCDAEQSILSMAFSWDSHRLLALCRDEAEAEEGEGESLECTQVVWDLLSGDRDRIRVLAAHVVLQALPTLLRKIQTFLF